MNKVLFLLLGCIIAQGSVNAMESFPLHDAIMDKDVGRVKTLLDGGTDLGLNQPDKYGYLPLERAIYSGVHELVKLLLDHRVNVDQPCRWGTPLHVAAHLGDQVCVQLLLNYGANVHKKSADGRTPLYYAVVYDKPEAAQIIRKHMARIEMYACLVALKRLGLDSLTQKHIAQNIFNHLLLCLQQEFVSAREFHKLETEIFERNCIIS